MYINDSANQRYFATQFIHKLKKNGGSLPWLAGIRAGTIYELFQEKIDNGFGINEFFCLTAYGQHPEYKYPLFGSIRSYKKNGLTMKENKTPVSIIWSKYFTDKIFYLYNIFDCVDNKAKEILLERFETIAENEEKRSHKDAYQKFRKFISSYSPCPKFKEDLKMKRPWYYNFSSDTVYVNSPLKSRLGVEKALCGMSLSAFHNSRAIPYVYQKCDMEYGNLGDLLSTFSGACLAMFCGFRKSFLAEEPCMKELALKMAESLEYNNRLILKAIVNGVRAAKYIAGKLNQKENANVQ